MTWPPAWRLAAAGVCVASLVVFVGFMLANGVAGNVQETFASASGQFGSVTAILEAAFLVLKKVGQPVFLAAFALFAALSAVCAGIGTACFRFATTERGI
jgi:hypothetical protein